MTTLRNILYVTVACVWIFELCLIGDYCRLYGRGKDSPETASYEAGIFENDSLSFSENDYADMVAFVKLNSPTIQEPKEIAPANAVTTPNFVQEERPVIVCVESVPCCTLRHCPYVCANVGKGRGYDRNYNTVGFFLAPKRDCCHCLPFFDARIHCFTDRRLAANLGLGVRYLNCCGDVFGANVYYDYREGCWGGFHQMGMGMEVFTRCFDLRLNTYFPITRKACRKKCVFDDYDDGFIISCQTCQFAMKGADAEISKNLFGCGCFCFNKGIGPYYIADQCNKQIYGGKIRLTAKYNNTIYFDLWGTYDKFFCEKLYGRLTISIPFDYFCPRKGCCLGNFNCPTKNSCCCKLDPSCYPLYRNDLIILRKRCLWDWNYCDDPNCTCDHEADRPKCKNKCSCCH